MSKTLADSIKIETMKLVIVTVVDEYKKDIIKLFKQAQINNFSESDI